MPSRLTIEEFITKAKLVHGKKYDYSSVDYHNSQTKVTIECKKCHHIFCQRPNDHLNGKGCIKCSGKYKYSNEEFILKANKVHKCEYDYSNVKYINSHRKVKIICLKHGEFNQMPYHHLRGSKCPECLHKVSRMENNFLDYLGIKKRNYSLPQWKRKYVDGYDPEGNIVYEFLGDYWHGNPEVYEGTKINPDTKLSYDTLLKRTFEKLNKIKSLGYRVKFIWENDWNKFQRGFNTIPQIYSVL